jgi:hypothetical protein
MRISNFLCGILQKIIIWAYTPDADELAQMRAEDLAKIAELGKQARELDYKTENVALVNQ